MNHDSIIIALGLICLIFLIGFIWTVIMLEEIRYKTSQVFDRILYMTTTAQVDRDRLIEEIYECENNPDFHGHSIFEGSADDPYFLGYDLSFKSKKESGHLTPWGLALIFILLIALAHTIFVRWL